MNWPSSSSPKSPAAAALRLLERHDAIQAEKLRWLQKSWTDGIASGDSGEFEPESVKAEARKILEERRGLAVSNAG